jgi:peptidoglycan/LPS O-acetylase OafA/YrhL
MKVTNYREDIDGLRSLAVIAVVLAHYWPSILPGGFLGVDIFFVISGYVITSSLHQKTDSSFRVFITSFYARRIKRLLPALLVCVFTISMIGAMVVPNSVVSFKTAISALLGAANIYLSYASIDYFGQSSELNLFTHTWSLGIEEQFYLVFPFLFWFLYSQKKLDKSTVFYTKIAFFVSVLGFVLVNSFNKEFAYYFTPVRAWELGVGAFIFYKRRTVNLKSTNNFLLAALVLMVGILFISESYLVYTSMAIVLLTSLILLYGKNTGAVSLILTALPMRWLGVRSYSIYLWHWPLLVLFKRTIGIQNNIILFCSLSLCLAIAHFSYTFIEQPCRRLQLNNKNIIQISGVMLLFTMISVYVVAVPIKNHLLIVPNYTGQAPVHDKLNCHTGTIEKCLHRVSTEQQIFIIGDSHATNLVPSISKAVINNDVGVSYFGGIKFIRSIFNDISCLSLDCFSNELGNLEQQFEKVLKANDIVIFSMSRSRLYLPSNYNFEGVSRKGLENTEKIKLLKEALMMMKAIVINKGGSIIFVDDIPVICSLDNFMRSNFVQDSCQINYEQSLADREPLSNLFESLLGENVMYIDPHDSLCSSEDCVFIKSDASIYSDTSPHISENHKFILSTLFEDKLKIFFE